MGSNTSKAAEAPKTQVWTSESPVRFSQSLVDGLQGSTESDSTRSKTLELHIQSRVNAELQKLHEQATKDFETLSAKISAHSTSSSPSDKAKSAGDTLRELGRESVQNEVQELKRKLEQRKKIKDVDEGVERAKAEVVKCLRGNDRRPLDCWREVEEFKKEVGRLEGIWVEKVVR